MRFLSPFHPSLFMIIIIVNQFLVLVSSGNDPDDFIRKIWIVSVPHRNLIIFFEPGRPFICIFIRSAHRFSFSGASSHQRLMLLLLNLLLFFQLQSLLQQFLCREHRYEHQLESLPHPPFFKNTLIAVLRDIPRAECTASLYALISESILCHA